MEEWNGWLRNRDKLKEWNEMEWINGWNGMEKTGGMKNKETTWKEIATTLNAIDQSNAGWRRLTI